MATPIPTSVGILLYEGVRGAEAWSALAALRAAGWQAEFVASEALVPSWEGARLVPHRLGVEALEASDVAILPGGRVEHALLDPLLCRSLRARRGRWTLASGEAIALAAAAGLAHERRVAHPPGEPALEGTRPAPARLVADGRLLTSLPGDPLVDLVLHLVERLEGSDAARRAAHGLGREASTFALGAQDEP